jgi:HPt (histidine-containing phosphotransfer) domain-containing protein
MSADGPQILAGIHLDGEVLLSLQDIMQDEYVLLLDTFLADSANRLQRLEAALEDGDADALRQTAHSFKGSCSSMGARALAALCQQLEEAGRDHRQSEAAELLERVTRELAIVRILLRAERQRHGGGCDLA